MRAIKFRGKALFDGRRVEGDLQHDGELILIVDAIHRETVDPESVEQLIAIDRNGREVYENDVIRYAISDKLIRRATMLDMKLIGDGQMELMTERRMEND